jgi:hypothetical protein
VQESGGDGYFTGIMLLICGTRHNNGVPDCSYLDSSTFSSDMCSLRVRLAHPLHSCQSRVCKNSVTDAEMAMAPMFETNRA